MQDMRSRETLLSPSQLLGEEVRNDHPVVISCKGIIASDLPGKGWGVKFEEFKFYYNTGNGKLTVCIGSYPICVILEAANVARQELKIILDSDNKPARQKKSGWYEPSARVVIPAVFIMILLSYQDAKKVPGQSQSVLHFHEVIALLTFILSAYQVSETRFPREMASFIIMKGAKELIGSFHSKQSHLKAGPIGQGAALAAVAYIISTKFPVAGANTLEGIFTGNDALAAFGYLVLNSAACVVALVATAVLREAADKLARCCNSQEALEGIDANKRELGEVMRYFESPFASRALHNELRQMQKIAVDGGYSPASSHIPASSSVPVAFFVTPSNVGEGKEPSVPLDAAEAGYRGER